MITNTGLYPPLTQFLVRTNTINLYQDLDFEESATLMMIFRSRLITLQRL